MNIRFTTKQIDEWLQSDIEVAQASATELKPSLQRQVVLEALKRIESQENEPKDAIKILTVTQTILAGIYHLLGESEAIEIFESLIYQAFNAECKHELRPHILTVAALIFNRTRHSAESVSEKILATLSTALINCPSPLEKALIVPMIERIKASINRAKESRHRTKRQFSFPDLNISQSASNVRDDIEGDWYQDPWGWPEIEWLAQSPDRVLQQLARDQHKWTIPIDVSKRDGGNRPGLVINPLDRIAFQTLVDELSIEAAAHLPKWAFGWRLDRQRVHKGNYNSNKVEWKNFSEVVISRRKQFRYTAHLDIESFFANVDISRLLSQLGRRYRHAGVIDRLEAYLQSWRLLPNGGGIPQRFLASAVLAHSVLKPLDTYLDKKSRQSESKMFLASRWMDDLWLHSDNEETLRASVIEVQNILGEIGLSLNSAKTAIFESQRAIKLFQLVDVYEEREEEPDLTLLKLLEGTERFHEPPAFQIGLEVSRLISQKKFSHLSHFPTPDFFKFDYVADRLAKALRASGDWRKFAGTYVDHAKMRFSEEDLSIALWGQMFPNLAQNDLKLVKDFYAERLLHGLQRVVTPLAAQRLASWDERLGLDPLSAIDLQSLLDCDDFFRVRGICYAMLKSSNFKDIAQESIQSFDDITVEFLRERNFLAPALSERFEAQ